MPRWIAGLFVVVLLAFIGPLPARAESVTIATLDWPPYTSKSLPLGGATTAVVRDAFAKAGLGIKVEYLPWKRAIETAKDDAGVVAYYPGYHCHHVKGFVPSHPIGDGPLGFAENVDHPVVWKSLANLIKQKTTIGTVLGYANTKAFDADVRSGQIRAIPAPNDLTNLRKLARDRIDLAVIDKLVMSYLLATEPSLKGDAKILKFNSQPLAEKTLFICFNDTKAGHALRDRFNRGLATINVEQVVKSYFAEQF